MIIKSHLHADLRALGAYLDARGDNEATRIIEISDFDAEHIVAAFENMWAIARNSKVEKALHHISINPYRDEQLTDEAWFKIITRCEKKFGYLPNDHQRVVVEHLKKERRHVHVAWNRVSLTTGKAVNPFEHWKKSKQVSREMERELGLRPPVPRRYIRALSHSTELNRRRNFSDRYDVLKLMSIPFLTTETVAMMAVPSKRNLDDPTFNENLFHN